MPGLNIDLSVKYKQILKAFQTEIQTVAAIYEKNKQDPEILRNISPVAGRIGWVRQLYRRIETPMMVFSKMSNVLKVSYILNLCYVRKFLCSRRNVESMETSKYDENGIQEDDNQ